MGDILAKPILNVLNRWNFGLGYGVLSREQDKSDRAARAAGNQIVEKRIVKLSHGQAAVCVALMVLSGFQPGVAQQAQQAAPAPPAQAQSTQATPTTPALEQPINNSTKWNTGLPRQLEI